MYIPYKTYKNFPKNAGVPDHEIWRRWSIFTNQGRQNTTTQVCPGSITLVDAGTPAVNGIYCPDGENLGYPKWTKIGGISLEDSIHFQDMGGGGLFYWIIISGGVFQGVSSDGNPGSPSNIKYINTEEFPGPPEFWTTAGGGEEPPPTYG